jgi:rhodanese-related sulfurtransferase
MKSYKELVNDVLSEVTELFPWDLAEELEAGRKPLIVDIREPYEFDAMHIKDSLNVPRGILESACDYDYEETISELAGGKDKDIVLVCRSGYRSVLAAYVMQLMGFSQVRSLKTGLRGWNDYEQPLCDKNENEVDLDDADEYFTARLQPNQKRPNSR